MSETTRASKIPRVFLLGAVALLAAVIGAGIWQRSQQTAPAPADNVTGTNTGGAGAAPTIASLEARTAKDKTDAEAWQLLGWSYFEAGRYADAASAYRSAANVSPDNAVYWSSLGEALTMANARDPMPAAAAAAFDTAIRLDPKDPRARYFIAVRSDLDGNHSGAIGQWLALLGDTPAGAPWEADLVRTIEQVGLINKIDVAAQIAAARKNRKAEFSLAAALPRSIAAAPIPGPTRGDMAAASKLPPGQQQAMVQTMVNGLEAKLAKNPSNIGGWIMLMRSRMTLGETAKANTALKKAIAANPAAREQLLREAEILGVVGA